MTVPASRYVTALWEARAREGKEPAMRTFMRDTVTATRHDPGCLDYEAHEVEGQPGTFIVWERWESPDALAAHQQTPRMQALITQVLPMMAGTFEEGVRLLRPLRPAH